MRRLVKPLIASAAILILMVAPVMAQTMPAQRPAAPGAPGLEPAPRIPSPPQEKLIDGPVKKVDPASKTVQVGWFLGLFRTTLAVTEDTRIAVEGSKGTIADIREGARVKASYEFRDGKNFAKSIEVMPEERARVTSPTTESPGRSPTLPGSEKTQ